MFRKVFLGFILSGAVVLVTILGIGSMSAQKVSSDAMVPRAYLPVIIKGFTTGGDPSRYNFEVDNQNWWPETSTAAKWADRVSTYAYQGNYSLRMDFVGLSGGTEPPNGNPANARVWTSDVPGFGPGTRIVARVLLPSGSPSDIYGLIWVHDVNYKWTAGPSQPLVPGSWNTLMFTVPAGTLTPIRQTGIQIYKPVGAGSWSGSVYIDSVDW